MLIAILTYYATRLIQVMNSYRNGLEFARFNCVNFPTFYNTYINLGAEYGFKNMWGSAIDTWSEGLQYRQTDFKLNYNLACALFSFNNLYKARELFIRAKSNMFAHDLPWLKDLDEKLKVCNDKLGVK